MTDINILLIDDDIVDIKSHKRLLALDSQRSFHIDDANSISHAIDKLNEKKYDCILLDYNLPGYTGFELLDKISNIEYNKYTPIILLTGQGDEKIAVNAFKKGISDYLIKADIDDKILVQTILNALDKNKAATIKKEQDNEIKKMAFKDPLTKLYNRRGFSNAASKFISYSKRHFIETAILYIDIDNFKKINDTYGHGVGDELIALIGEQLVTNVRNEDLVARLGGDEFIIFLTKIKSVKEPEVVAKKILLEVANITDNIKSISSEIKTSISIGISLYDHSLDLDANIEQADNALLTSKKSGKNRYTINNKKY